MMNYTVIVIRRIMKNRWKQSEAETRILWGIYRGWLNAGNHGPGINLISFIGIILVGWSSGWGDGLLRFLVRIIVASCEPSILCYDWLV